MHHINPYRRVLLISLLCFIPFIAARVALFFIYHESFNALSTSELVWAFLYGLRFDAAIIITFIGLPLVLMLLPFEWAHRNWWQGTWLWFIFLVLLSFVLALSADLIYFGFVQRHVGPEVTLFTEDPQLMLDIIFSEHGGALLSFTVLGIGAAYMWRQVFSKPVKHPERYWLRAVLIILLVPALIIVGRGGLQYKPLRPADAFALGNAASGYLSLNGAFAIVHAMRGQKPKLVKFMPDEEAIAITQSLIKGPNEEFVDPEYPLMRKTSFPDDGKPKPNVVIFIMESWDANHVDVLRKELGLEPLGISPNFDALSKEGTLFTHFYANGRRSMDGIAAILAGIPTLPGVPYIGQGLEQSKLSYLGHLAKEQGYSTYFLQTSHRGSFRLDSIAAQAGFDTYLGAEDTPSLHKDVTDKSDWGAWDHETFQEGLKQFSATKQPFLGVMFSSTTHSPWRVPGEQWKKFPHDSEINQFRNTFYYSDWALGEFFKEAKKTDFYKNTIFLITGDHIGKFGTRPGDERSKFHVPMLILSAKNVATVSTQTGSQSDIVSTIINLGHWNLKYSALGKTLFEPMPINDRTELGINGSIVNIISDKLWIAHDLNKVIDKSDANDQEVARQTLKGLALYQTTINLLMSNKVYSDINNKLLTTP